MHVKRVVATIQDETGQPVPGGRIWLPTADDKAQEGRKKKKSVGRTGRAQWQNVYFSDGVIVTEYEAPEGYEPVDIPGEIVLEGDEDEIILPIVVRPRPSERLDQELEESSVQANVNYGPQSQAEQSAGVTGQYSTTTDDLYPAYEPSYVAVSVDFVDGLVAKWEEIADACNLTAAFDDAIDVLDDASRADWCDPQARKFVKRLGPRVAILRDSFHPIADYATGNELTGPDGVKQLITTWVDRLADMMTAYRGFYDLILLEVESGQLPYAFLADNRAALEAPFESYHCCQKLTGQFIYLLERGPVGTCLAELSGGAADLVETTAQLESQLSRFDTRAMPAAAGALTTKTTTLAHDLDRMGAQLQAFAARYRANQNTQTLDTVLAQLITHRQEALGLITALREAVRTEQLLPQWHDRANWMAVGKRNLTAIWQHLNGLIGGVRDCHLLINSGIDDVWFDRWMGSNPQLSKLRIQTANLGVGNVGGSGGIVLDQTNGSGSGGGNNFHANSIGRDIAEDMRDSLSDLATFAPTVNDGGGWSGSYGGGNGGDGGYYGRRIAQAYAAVTGQPLPHDPNAFRNSLRATFPADPLTGEIVAEPVRSVISLYNDAGPLSSDQATLSQFVGLIISDAHKLLGGLRSIDPGTDNEQAGALTSIVGHSFDVLADEAARGDRPRRPLVDDTFEALLGGDGYLEDLREELGLNSEGDSLDNPNLVTTEEAQLMANMNLLEEYAVSLQDAYNRYFLTPTGQDPRDGSFSGRAAYVSLLFSVVAHSVREVEEAMSAVDFSQPERRTTFITDPASETLISIDSILRWIENLMVNTGPRLVADSGLIGLNRVLQTIANRIDPLVNELAAISRGNSTTNPPPAPHPGLTHRRVRNALAQLDSQIEQF